MPICAHVHSRFDARARAAAVAVAGLLCAVFLLCASHASAAVPAPEIQPAKPELSDSERAALDALFEKFEAAFNTNSAEAVALVLVPGAEKNRLLAILNREFTEVEYSFFQIEKADPEYRIGKNRLSIDATLRCKIAYRDGSRPAVDNLTIQNFTLHKRVSGEFLILNSSFFENMGKRGGGTRLFLDGFAAIGVLFALLVFWVVMGLGAWSERPRSVLWRAAVFIPVLGPLLFFFVRYLPQVLRRK